MSTQRWIWVLAGLVAAISSLVPAHAQTSLAAGRQAKNVAIISIKGLIDDEDVMPRSVNRRINEAVRAGADAIVFEIDSTSGSVDGALKISGMIKACPIKNTVAWINHDAYSTSSAIALACSEIVVNEPSKFGDVMANAIAGFQFRPGPGGMGGVSGAQRVRKTPASLIADLIDSARRYNTNSGAYLRDELLCQAIAVPELELWYIKNKTTGQKMCIDRHEFEMLFPGVDTGGVTRLPASAGVPSPAPAPQSTIQGPLNPPIPTSPNPSPFAAGAGSPSLRPVLTTSDAGNWELIEKVKDASLPAFLTSGDMFFYGLCANDSQVLSNKLVAFRPMSSDSDILAFFGAVKTHRYDSNWSEAMVNFLTNFIVRGVLIAIFLIAVFLEMSHPGTLVPACVAALALGLFLGPAFLIGMATWWEIAAILAGLILLALEAFVIPGFGVAGVLGLILLFAGLVFTFVPARGGGFGLGESGRHDLMRGAVTMLVSFGTAAFSMYFLAKHFGSIPLLGRLVLKTAHGDDDSGGILSAMDDSGDFEVRVGEVGQAITPMRPVGRVQVGDKIIDAVAEFGFIEDGSRVRVVSASGMRVSVELFPEKKGTPPNA